MKPKIIILFSIWYLSILSIESQLYEYIPTVKENTQWSYCDIREYDADGNGVKKHLFYSFIYIQGDTIINNVQYKKVYHFSCDKQESTLRAVMREENQKVFVINDISYKDEEIIYDYTMEVGDCINIHNYFHTVVKIDSVEISGKLRKRFFFDSYQTPIIEGIGTLDFYYLYDIFGDIIPENGLHLNFYKEDGRITYHTDEWFFIEEECPEKTELRGMYEVNNVLLENPVKDYLQFNLDFLSNSYEIEILDTQGKILKIQKISSDLPSVYVGNLSNGIYLFSVKHNGQFIYKEKFIKQ